METPAEPLDQTVIAQWQEPDISTLPRQQTSKAIIIGGAGLLFAALIGLGVWQKDITFYFAAVVVIVATIAVLVQNRAPARNVTITLTESQLAVGEKYYPLPELAGFWLEEEPGFMVVNVEPLKGALMPITFLHPATDPEEARETMLQVMPEVEPRQKNLSDSVSRFLRF